MYDPLGWIVLKPELIFNPIRSLEIYVVFLQAGFFQLILDQFTNQSKMQSLDKQQVGERKSFKTRFLKSILGGISHFTFTFKKLYNFRVTYLSALNHNPRPPQVLLIEQNVITFHKGLRYSGKQTLIETDFRWTLLEKPKKLLKPNLQQLVHTFFSFPEN